MTLALIIIDNQREIFVSIVLNIISKEFRIITESTNDEQISAFFCTAGSSHCSSIGVLFKNPLPVSITNQDGKFQMTTIFLIFNDKIYTINCLTYNITTKSYKIDREKLATWEKVTFSLSSRVYKICIHRKSFQEPSFNEYCEHLPIDLINWHFTERTQKKFV